MDDAPGSQEPEQPLPDTVAERLQRVRRRRFVGRVAEVELFREAVDAAEPAFAVLFVHGPGGVGKTALLDELAGAAEGAGVASVRIDLRAIEPSPPAFRAALVEALGSDREDEPAEVLAQGPRRVLLLDTYESVQALDAWLRERFLPALPTAVLVVIAGRNRPSDAWLADPGWRELLRVVSLRNLRPEEARAYLHAEGIDEEIHARALELTRGHPLALSLFVDVLDQRSGSSRAAQRFELADEPDAVRPLLERFVSEAPSPRHREALEVCAHARFTTEDLLRSGTGADDAPELFDWLRGLSFIEQGALGLFPHDLAREVLDADLRWRAPEAYAELHGRIRSHLVDRVGRRGGRWGQVDAADLIFMHRRNPMFARFMDWPTFGTAYGDRLQPSDREKVLAIAESHEGPESARLASIWLERQPESFIVFRDAEEGVRGFAAVLALHAAGESDLAADPGAESMWRYGQSHGAPRPGEGVYATRFLIDRDDYQGPAALNVFSVIHTQLVLSRRRASWEFLAWADPEAAMPLMAYIDFQRTPEADYEIGGRRYGVFTHDWRRVDIEAWLELTGERELEAGDEGAARAERPTAVLALSQPDFADAVRQALRDLHRTDALARNPLLRSRAVADAGGEPTAETLRDLLGEAIGALRVDPRDEKLHRALARTYVRPAQTQELAAEALGLPFSTYRRHLTQGVERVTAWLWQRELYGSDA